jgi:hypothetical protein
MWTSNIEDADRLRLFRRGLLCDERMRDVEDSMQGMPNTVEDRSTGLREMRE